ncbi:transcriptional regulator, LysR family [Bordetella hinzii 5132]|nr:transcriptional regulator, LysR family [Bordetella hinzii 5132]
MLDWDSLRYFLEVARSQRVSAAARTLGVEHTTVARRIRALEAELGSLLFEKSRSAGFVLTEDGQRLFVYAEQMESTVHTARESLSGIGQALSGHIRIGATEGFGSYVVTPLAADFQRRYPHITLDILPVPRFVSLSKREADLAITIERPQRGPYVCSRLCDYTLMLYGTPQYLARHPPIRSRADLAGHSFIGYVASCCSASGCATWRISCPTAGSCCAAPVWWRNTMRPCKASRWPSCPASSPPRIPGSHRCWVARSRSRAASGCIATRTSTASSASACCGTSCARRPSATGICSPAAPASW